MLKIISKLIFLSFLLSIFCQDMEENAPMLKNWLNTCSITMCSMAINLCINQCSGVSNCKACITNIDPLCAMCANDIFNTNYMLQVYGQNYLLCDQYDIFQTKVCQIYCKGNSKSYGECKNFQSLGACFCYSGFNGNLYKTIDGNSQIKAVASSSNYGEFAVGFTNGSISVFDNYGRHRRSFIIESSREIRDIIYLSNGDIGVSGSFGTRLYSNSGSQKMSFTTSTGYAITILKNGELAYGVGNSIYINNLSQTSPRLVLNGHTNWICSLLALPNGDLVSGSYDRTIKIWNTVDGSLKKTLVGHTDWVNSLILLESGDIASGSDDRSIRIWNINIGVPIRIIQTDHSNYIRSIVLLPNGKIASASVDKTIKIWDKDYGTLIKTLNGHTNTVYLAVNSYNYLVSVSHDMSIKLWN